MEFIVSFTLFMIFVVTCYCIWKYLRINFPIISFEYLTIRIVLVAWTVLYI